jgi:YD repeat-containing protein
MSARGAAAVVPTSPLTHRGRRKGRLAISELVLALLVPMIGPAQPATAAEPSSEPTPAASPTPPDYSYATTMTYYTSATRAGRLKDVTDPLGNKTAYDYDPVGRLVSVVDALSNECDGP